MLPVIVIALLTSLPTTTEAGHTGTPLLTFSVHPCRILDTRVDIGPLQGSHAMDVHVRGSSLLEQEEGVSSGAQRADCHVPPEAEAVMVNVTVINPQSGGHLKINGYGAVNDPMGSYSRLNYRIGENDSNEIFVNLCNVFNFPGPHVPCGFDGERYQDFQILNGAPSTSSTHIVIEVVGYFTRHFEMQPLPE